MTSAAIISRSKPVEPFYIDIETIPSQSAELADTFRREVKAPAQYKKPESIAEWLAENRDAVASEQMAKTSFDPAHGHICTIAWADGDGEIMSAHAATVAQERGVIQAMFDSISFLPRMFVGHFISGFDMRFILCRAIVLGVQIPHSLPRDPKPWGGRVFDTMTAWAGTKGTISQDRLCAALGLPGKGDFDGSMVAQAWADGEHAKIESYCRDDVATVREIHRKFVAANW